ncbi:nucleotide sugar dehydrogenase [Virgibacillus natechei]|uniref:Nucleotide sugar dehydrogenase n=1 Tax=Virgibacillus natechei TaxID=1216297 RepID=A0ABS4IBY7_9BACI|nr:nucleotide sugar dehydrogenase [Virgibacillus natechei]MBP1968449.1 nucleotide sugar dehydrogenase [Virgibacillus natechei]UZD13570.1 nucleotide sugar dehydrogenase [Virgibacillus natechei]
MIDQSTPLPNVAVVGLGKIGLPLAAIFANNGYKVFGADINKDVVTSINQGESHVKNEPGLDHLVLNAHKNKTLSATTATSEAVAQSNIIVVIVPVLVDEQNNIDYKIIDRAVQDIAKGVKKGSLIIFETTLPPGDTKNKFGEKIEDISGLTMGEDFYLAYSPERVYSNQIIQDLQNYSKVVGGVNKKSLELASNFYKKALDCKLIEVSSLETAEFSKVAECVYRDVNIALANELAQFAEDKSVNMSEVITASNSQPFSHLHSPGIGVGGHCIPIYPYFFINKGLDQGLTSLSRKVNDNMSNYAISKIKKRIGSLQNKNILILGLSYRENVKETTKSTALLLIDQLKDNRANLFVNDPLFSDSEIAKYGANPLSLNDSFISEIDVVILQAFHQEYSHLDFHKFASCKLVLDGRNKLNKKEISQLGIQYEGIGN